jgi:hypothetical protein
MFGWLQYYKGIELDQLSLQEAVPSPSERGAWRAWAYVNFLSQGRGVTEDTISAQLNLAHIGNGMQNLH